MDTPAQAPVDVADRGQGNTTGQASSTSEPDPHSAWPIRGLDAAMLGLLGLLVICHLAAAWLAAGWRTAALTDLLALVYLALLATHQPWRPLLLRLMALGLVAGVLELATDAAGENFAHSLSYPPGEPLLWASPVYMPVSWMLVLSVLAYLAWRLADSTRRMALGRAVALTALAGAINIPFYEEAAAHAGWWHYTPARLMLGHTPVYVLLFEGAVAASLPLLVAGLPRFGWGAVALRGAIVGVWMPIAALLAWLVLGRW